jgi:NAD(P)-dependent dehydrogenase (short-subunit alcohol dehydrogenase family)
MTETHRKVVIISGGANGIGRAAALAFSSEGYAVTVADLDEEALGSAVDEITSQQGAAISVGADVSLAPNARQVIERTVLAFGGVDVLFNNVGIQPVESYRRAEDLSEESWDRIMSVNVKSHFLLSKYAIPEMRKRGGGVIINNASVQGLQSQNLVPAYAASKGAVLSLTRNLALDYAPDNIRVLAVCPGSVDTLLLQSVARHFSPEDPEGTVREWGRRHPMDRVADPQEIANVVVFLASEKASFMTGEWVCVDGGIMAKGAWAGS